ncbi:hypothetical protein IC582_006104 [Cucumis melo]
MIKEHILFWNYIQLSLFFRAILQAWNRSSPSQGEIDRPRRSGGSCFHIQWSYILGFFSDLSPLARPSFWQHPSKNEMRNIYLIT